MFANNPAAGPQQTTANAERVGSLWADSLVEEAIESQNGDVSIYCCGVSDGREALREVTHGGPRTLFRGGTEGGDVWVMFRSEIVSSGRDYEGLFCWVMVSRRQT